MVYYRYSMSRPRKGKREVKTDASRRISALPEPPDEGRSDAADTAAPTTARALTPGLHLLSTPIGAARDITLRGLDALMAADMLAAEDTRTLRRLMEIHGVALGARPLVPYHDHNAEQARPRILSAIAEGQSVVYASDAGTPLIADPGWKLARAVREAGGAVTALPGPCAAIDGLVLSGAPTDAFSFIGFPPVKSAARRTHFERWRGAPGSLVFYESPRRLAECLADAASVLGPRMAAVTRELTKMFEEVRRDTLDALAAHYAAAGAPKGEVVVVIDPGTAPESNPEDIDAALRQALQSQSVRDAATNVAEMFETARKPIYQRALEISRDMVENRNEE